MSGNTLFQTRAFLREDVERLGIRPGDAVMVHAEMSRVGRLLNGPDALSARCSTRRVRAERSLAYTDWDARHDELLDRDGRVAEEWRAHVPPFDPSASRAARENGVLAEFIRTWPGSRRSGNPAASVVAVGARAEWFTADHPLDYGYGDGSPLAKLVAAKGKVLMVGAPFDTMTLLHYAEHLSRIPGKRVRRYEVPFAATAGTLWRMVEEFETSLPVAPALEGDYSAPIVADFLTAGQGMRGPVGEAPGTLVEAAVTAFAIGWLERQFG